MFDHTRQGAEVPDDSVSASAVSPRTAAASSWCGRQTCPQAGWIWCALKQ